MKGAIHKVPGVVKLFGGGSWVSLVHLGMRFERSCGMLAVVLVMGWRKLSWGDCNAESTISTDGWCEE